MDPVIGALIESRKKSVAKLEVEVGALAARVEKATVPALMKVLEGQRKTKSARLELLRGELAALLAEAERQVELPGTSPAASPGKAPGAPGRGR